MARTGAAFDYQSDWHCAKTAELARHLAWEFDYQSDWHCAKTFSRLLGNGKSLITSQSDTAPKQELCGAAAKSGLITSQIDTAPKQRGRAHHQERVWLPVRLTLRQNWQRAYRDRWAVWLPVRLTLRQNHPVNPSLYVGVWLPVRLTLRQNRRRHGQCQGIVWLPVRLTLRQNAKRLMTKMKEFDYQSDWHCAKTRDASWIKIHYGKNGTHAVPFRPFLSTIIK